MQKRGFTLIELLVVIAIIGILTSIITVGLGNARVAARDTKRVADIKNIQLALATYYFDNLRYPCRIYPDPTGTDLNNVCAPITTGPPLFATYMNTPLDSDSSQYKYAALNATAGGGCGSGTVLYHLGAVVENPDGSLVDQDNDYVGHTACLQSLANFHGNATACTGVTAASPDPCYDVRP